VNSCHISCGDVGIFCVDDGSQAVLVSYLSVLKRIARYEKCQKEESIQLWDCDTLRSEDDI
jgi:hypothetical protein